MYYMYVNKLQQNKKNLFNYYFQKKVRQNNDKHSKAKHWQKIVLLYGKQTQRNHAVVSVT